MKDNKEEEVVIEDKNGNEIETDKSKFKFNLKRFVFLILIGGFLYYGIYPVINLQSQSSYILVSVVICLLISCFFDLGKIYDIKKKKFTLSGSVIFIAFIFIAGYFVMEFFSSKLVNSRKYASLITVEEGNFTNDIIETSNINDIAIMDTASARIIGERAIGSLSEVVSQYVVSQSYSTIDYNAKPMKIASLEYADFFKWINNRQSGIPGYVIVDPVKNEANYVELKTPIKYTPSGYFGDNLGRHIQFKYPFFIFENYHFELDNEGNPYYVCPVLKSNAGLFGAKDVKGVVICDPCTGNTEYYSVADVPQWVDRVYDGDLAEDKYDWYGTLSGGYWNSVFGNKGCKRTTDDYGYKVMNGDVWIYTGVTSVNSDESNIGFVLINLRTCESKYYSIAGAEEYSAMSSAEGQVQNLGYQASFPSLINISNSPTYIMALKDNSGLVKLYALVNVQKYNIVATGKTQNEALSEYKKLLVEYGVIDGTSAVSSDMPTKEITIKDIKFISNDGNTTVYITDMDRNVYKQAFSENELLITLEIGDKVKVLYSEESENEIYDMFSFEK